MTSQAGKCGACYPAHGEVAEVAGQCWIKP